MTIAVFALARNFGETSTLLALSFDRLAILQILQVLGEFYDARFKALEVSAAALSEAGYSTYLSTMGRFRKWPSLVSGDRLKNLNAWLAGLSGSDAERIAEAMEQLLVAPAREIQLARLEEVADRLRSGGAARRTADIAAEMIRARTASP